MTDKPIQPGSADIDLASALAKDLQAGLARDVKALSEADFYCLRQAVREVDADRSGQTAKNEMDAKIRGMSDRELERYLQDIDSAARGAK